MNTTNELQSNTIDYLRFPLVVFVIFIHNYQQTVSVPGSIIGNENYMPIYHLISELFSKTLGSIAVPLFYIIAGFLFFINVELFSIKCYRDKLKSRVRTLLIPYLFWNIATIAFYYTCYAIPPIRLLMNVTPEFSVSYFLKSLWMFHGGEYPIAYQFWFIRDLMVISIMSPIIYFAIKKLKLIFIFSLSIIWLSGWRLNFEGYETVSALFFDSIFFFSAGGWFSINKKSLLSEMKKVSRLSYIFYPIFGIADLITKNHAYNIYFHKLGIILGIMFSFNLVSHLLKTKKINPAPFLSAAAFFVFSIHHIPLTALRKASFSILNPNTEILTIILYFSNVFIVTIFALFMYYFLRKHTQGFIAFVTGR